MIFLPTLNACLNSASAVLLVAGYLFIRKGNIQNHKRCMIGATVTSIFFLASYLYYHYHHGSTKFQGVGAVRWVYFTILLTHTILAAVQVPLIGMTILYAVRGRVEAHKRLARITWPIWLYVSVTGVVIYFMLYHFFKVSLVVDG